MSEQLVEKSGDATVIELRDNIDLDRDYRETSSAFCNTWWYTYAVEFNDISKLSMLQDRFTIIYSNGSNFIVKDTQADVYVRSEQENERCRLSAWFDAIMPRTTGKEPAILCYFDDSWSGNKLYINNDHKRSVVIDTLTMLESISERIYICLFDETIVMYDYVK